MATKKIKDTEISSETPKKCKKVAKKAISDAKMKMNESVYIYHTGDDLEKISELLTGKKYMIYRILQYSGINMNQLKDGDILKWGV